MRQRVDRPRTPFTRPHWTLTNTFTPGDDVVDGLPAYYQGQAPDHRATARQLDERGMKRAAGQGPVGWLWVSRYGRSRLSGRVYTNWELVALYDLAHAVPKRPMTARQRAVLKAARDQAEFCRFLGTEAYKVDPDGDQDKGFEYGE